MVRSVYKRESTSIYHLIQSCGGVDSKDMREREWVEVNPSNTVILRVCQPPQIFALG